MALIGGTMVTEPRDTPEHTGWGVQAPLGFQSLSQRQWEAFDVFQVLESLEGIHHCRKTRPAWPRDEPVWCLPRRQWCCLVCEERLSYSPNLCMIQ